MHDCQRFREDWIAECPEDDVVDFGDCQDCRSFCQEAQLILQATDGANNPVPELSVYDWQRFEVRLRENLVHENASHRYQFYWKWSAMAAAAAGIAVVMTWGGIGLNNPIVVEEEADATPQIEFVDDHIEGLNPTVVEFLGQSELFLRNFTKIDEETDSSYQEDLQYAQARARRGLDEIAQQKQRAADFVPVRIALEEYEGVLRDISNLDSADELSDIQSRIHRNGLIANMKAYQPQAMLVSQR
jgi:hypothetical protein